MKIIEFNPDSQSTAFSPYSIPTAELQMNGIYREILPLIFHKLKNKLTPILGYAQILQSRSSDAFMIERLRKIETNTSELAEAMNTLKDYFKTEPAPLLTGNVNLILQDMAAHWQKIANAGQTRIVLDLDPEAFELLLDAPQIKILLLQMVDNSVTALKMKTAPDREIRLSTRLEGDGLTLAIHDNGHGIDADDLDSIWTPFFAKFPGHAGLGLVVCEKIIANHWAASQVSSAPGQFSRFEVRFPKPEKFKKKQNKSVDDDPRSQT